MDAARWEKAIELHHGALELPEEERAAFLAEGCGDDADLLERLQAMLAEPPPRFLDAPTAPLGEAPLADTRLAEEGATFGDFELRRMLGVGGMGTVYLAHQRSLDREVALKILRAGDLAPDDVERFEAESRRVARLEHPNIVPVYVSGREEGLAFFAMPYLRGGSLADEIAAARAAGETLDRETCVRRVATIADALEYVHQQGMMHRDVKPANVLLDDGGQPFLADFGIARALDRETVTLVRGTPAYMSPEQALLLGERIDHRTDVYSLGVVLYELFALRRPHTADTNTALLYEIRDVDPPRLGRLAPDVPRDLETICHKAMRKRVEARYPTAGAFALDLRLFLEGRAIMARPTTALERGAAWLARHRLWATVALAVLITVPVVAGIVRASERRSAERAAGEGVAASLERAGERWASGDVDATLAELGEARSRLAAYEELLGGRRDRAGDLALELSRLAGQVQVRAETDLRAFAVGASRDPFGIAYGRVVDLALRLARAEQLEPATPGDAEAGDAAAVRDFVGSRVTLRSTPSGARVIAQRLDPLSRLPLAATPPTELGRTPLEAIAIDPGTYHFLFVAGEDLQGELVRTVFGIGQAIEPPRVWLRPAVDSGMVAIAGGPYAVHEKERRRAGGAEAVQLSSMLVDRTEVTSAAYHRFLSETGRAAPPFWPRAADPQTEGWGELPVVWVTLDDAEAFCAWAGKRLPTYYEWSRIARGAANSDTPWGGSLDDPIDVASRADVLATEAAWRALPAQAMPVPEVLEGPERQTAFETYRRYVRGVRGPTSDRSPEGVERLYGNVAEWTLATGVSQIGDAWIALPSEYHLRGRSWRALVDGLEESTGVPPQARNDNVGFRAVKGPPPASLILAGRGR